MTDRWRAGVAGRRTAVAAALLLAGATGTPALAAAPAHAGEPRLTAALLSRSQVRVDGFEVALLTVSVTVADVPDAVTTISMGWTGGARTPEGDIAEGRPRLVAGTLTDGTWQADLVVPSTAGGSWHIADVNDESGFGRTYSLNPRSSGLTDPTLSVRAAHRPHLALTARPDPVPWNVHRVRLTARLTDETGRRLRGRPLSLGMGSGCTYGARVDLRTDRHGRASVVLPTGRFADYLYVSVDLPPRLPLQRGDNACYTWQAASLRVGSHVDVTVHGRPAPHGHSRRVSGLVSTSYRDTAVTAMRRVELQRLVGRHWRTVDWAQVRPEGTFKLYPTPPRRGTFSYRVRYLGGGHVVGRVLPSVSRVLRITAT